MSRFVNSLKIIFSVFGTAEWQAENIKTLPSRQLNQDSGEYLRVDIVPSELGTTKDSINGLVLVDLFVDRSNCNLRSSEISDILDKYITNREVKDQEENVVQFFSSTLRPSVNDREERLLVHYQYSVSFNYHGVN